MGVIESFELAITSCIHLVRSKRSDYKPQAFGSGVVVKYKGRYFLCTAAHFSDYPDQGIGIVTGNIKDGQCELYYLGNLNYTSRITFEEDPDEVDLEHCLLNPELSGERLDAAYEEIPLLDNIIQDEKVLDLKGIGKITIDKGGKSILIVDEDYDIDTSCTCSFYGKIRPTFESRSWKFEEKLYRGLPIKSLDKHLIEMDLGAPIDDHTRFEGCSGAPIIDTRGKLIGLVCHGLGNSIYGFRFDSIKQWIDLTYFRNFKHS